MAVTEKFKDFNASRVPLQGSNLIEASAGTGKTYSIAILMLRLILEKQLLVKEVLMVTFTKAAVAELEERIRLFVRTAYKYVQGEEIADGTIMQLVDEAMENLGVEHVESLLRDAVLFLDETSVLTIHSFCQQTLTQFAFETKQLFGAETLQDTSAVLQDEVNKFWRKEVTTLPSELLEYLIGAGLSRASILNVVREHLGGKHYMSFREDEEYSYCEDDHKEILQMLRQLKATEDDLRQCLVEHLDERAEEIQQLAMGNSYAKKSLQAHFGDSEALLSAIVSKKSTGYIQKLFPDLLERHDECDDAAEKWNGEVYKVISRFNCMAIGQISRGIREYKMQSNQMSFDDMIVNLHEALVVRDQYQLVVGLREKYKAVFIDEFQDTDDLQYAIFQKAFGEDTILFYIGDPKQSIYAWRKADIETYFEAFRQAGQRYSMNTNYRSSAGFIASMNLFFQPVEGFDTFYFQGAADSIDYIQVESPVNNTKGELLKNGLADIPMSIIGKPNKDAISEGVAAQVMALLDDETYSILKNGKERPVRPSDIGILVRKNSEGQAIKRILSKYNIPAVTIGDTKVLKTEEAVELLYILDAMLNISLSTINRALLSPLTGLSIEDVLLLNEEQATERFGLYKSTWEKNGIYNALMDFISDFKVQQNLLEGQVENGERIITNLYQLVELFHKVQSSKILNPQELLSWLKRGIDGMETEGDEYLQRVESDEEAVKIVTIHKSKGLEYNIVLAPYLDFTFFEKREIFSFKHPELKKYVSAVKRELTDTDMVLISAQEEQENRRLLYVTITRGVYKCFIYKNTGRRNSTLETFTQVLKNADQSLIALEEGLEIPEDYSFRKGAQAWKPFVPEGEVDFKLVQQNWTRMSYSRLNVQHERSAKYVYRKHSGYEEFIFNQLQRGANTGNMLHFLFETINFTDSERWNDKIDAAIKRFAPRYQEDLPAMLHTLLSHAMNAVIPFDSAAFSLAGVNYTKRIHELEFDFTVPSFNPYHLRSLSSEGMSVDVHAPGSMEGLMNGKIDLFFEHEGKYYVLDWKSNYLGDTLEDYSQDQIALAMNENNYHLQYLLYTLAVKKYLQTRLPDFDYSRDFGGVVYMFLRGVRAGQATGIYVQKPSEDTIGKLEGLLSSDVI
ncbi:DNA helicase/exodeoxyribonuclease V beta subunit [Arcticibacter pallidicorallinus]|uniref:RecBCD enzyme subunit RecB n=1 Tax=Arcticibacter pallidicorallinus TaxID=1259464 RepID=A0A2T0TS50_9SPHI|nr:exodeoxyribonuclease V subunit beta [Arcticibacter pallidicorallinus]PRY48552.1 DNA helicase/exodeoxyribonuclease V beta subunit [Arcticibacter pallidicorallinus]